MTLVFTCPLSGQGLHHPCPVTRCPANLAYADPVRSCAYVLPDTNHDTLASILQVETSEVRLRSQQEVADLGQIMQDLNALLETNLQNHCPNCGYLTPCTSLSMCEERKETVDGILVNVGGEVSLKPAHIWYALLNGRDSFLTKDQRNRLLELANQKHVRNSSHGQQSDSSQAV